MTYMGGLTGFIDVFQVINIVQDLHKCREKRTTPKKYIYSDR